MARSRAKRGRKLTHLGAGGAVARHEPLRRVLVAQTACLGDLVLTLPLLAELRRARPQARLTALTTPEGAQLFAAARVVDDVIAFDKSRKPLASPRFWKLAFHLRRGGFDAAVAAHRSHRTAALLRLSGAPLRVGFDDAPGAWAYTRRVARDLRGAHAVERYLALSGPLGGDPDRAERSPRLLPPAAARERAAALLASAAPPGSDPRWLAIAPGSRWPTKRWLPERFAAVAAAARRLGLEPVVLGTAEERDLAERVARSCPGGAALLAGRTDVQTLAAVLARCEALVCNDSGPGHVAAAVGTPVVVVFGPTAPALGFTPLGAPATVIELESLACRPCGRHGARRCPLGHLRCMHELPAAPAIEALQRVVEATRTAAARGRGWSA